ncbi:hypothetical protein GEMRC1_009110 [Eukaryota sp. GEM-RC1]
MINTDFLLSSSCSFLPNLKQLILQSVGAELLKVVCSKLESNSTVLELSLRFYGDSPSLCSSLRNLIFHNKTKKKISIPLQDRCETYVNDAEFLQLCSAISRNVYVRELDFCGVVVETSSSIRHLFNTSSIKIIHLPGYEEEDCHIHPIEKLNSSIREIFLYDINLNLVNPFMFTNSLKELSIIDAEFIDQDMDSLDEVLRVKVNLRVLKIVFPRINDNQLAKFFSSLENNSSLEKVFSDVTI